MRIAALDKARMSMLVPTFADRYEHKLFIYCMSMHLLQVDPGSDREGHLTRNGIRVQSYSVNQEVTPGSVFVDHDGS